MIEIVTYILGEDCSPPTALIHMMLRDLLTMDTQQHF